MSGSATPPAMTMLVNGASYGGWEDIRASRGIDRCASEFRLTVSERWLGSASSWVIKPFDAVTLMVGNVPFLTGYAEVYEPVLGEREHSVRITGRSRTLDLVECKPDIPSGQFVGYSLAAIASAICALFGLTASVDPSAAAAVGNAVADSTIERGETAFTFLERLARLAAVLLCDTPDGNLLLTRTGSTRASGQLQIGLNCEYGRPKYDVRKRFSEYIVKGQAGVAGGAGGPDPLAGLARPYNEVAAPVTPPGGTGQVQTAQNAVARDAGVPRFRPHTSIAESQLTQNGLQQRANWQMAYAYGRSIELTMRVPGWLQPNGDLWAINQIVAVNAPQFGLQQDMLVTKVELSLSRAGSHTEISVAPPEGYTPDPASVKARKHARGHKGAVLNDLTGLAVVGSA